MGLDSPVDSPGHGRRAEAGLGADILFPKIFLTFRGKFFQFCLSGKISRFSSAKISDDLF